MRVSNPSPVPSFPGNACSTQNRENRDFWVSAFVTRAASPPGKLARGQKFENANFADFEILPAPRVASSILSKCQFYVISSFWLRPSFPRES